MLWNRRFAIDGWAVTSGQYQRSTGRLPDWFTKQPPAARGDDFYLAAFGRLATHRDFSAGGYGPIPWRESLQYGREFGLDPDFAVVFADVIAAMDAGFRKHLREQDEKEDSKKRREAARASHAAGAEPTKRRRRR